MKENYSAPVVSSLVLVSTLLLAPPVHAQPTPPPAPPLPAAPPEQTIKGSVLKLSERELILRDTRGQEVQLQIDKDTQMGQVKVGDMVTAEVTADGHLESVRPSKPETQRR